MTDDLYTVDDVAGKLGKTSRWVKTFARQNGIGLKAGRDRRFTQADYAILLQELRQCRSSSSNRGKAKRRVGTSGATISGDPLTEALRVANEPLPRKSSRAS